MSRTHRAAVAALVVIPAVVACGAEGAGETLAGSHAGGAAGAAPVVGGAGHGGADSAGRTTTTSSPSGAAGAPPAAPLELAINEVMPRNDAAAPDPNGAYPDWIELFNPGDAPVDLAGWSLTDDPQNPRKSVIPSGPTVPANGFLVLFADGGSGPDRLAFKLANDGGFVGLFAPDGRGSLLHYGAIASDFSIARIPDGCSGDGCLAFVYRGTPGESNVAKPLESVSLLPAGSVYHYVDTNVPPPADFGSPGFDDASLPNGPAPLGYGDPHIATTVGFGPDPMQKHVTTWFRGTFDVSGKASFTKATLGLVRDDGARVLLNGVEVARSNLPAGALDATTLATTGVAGAAETSFLGYPLDPAVLVEGKNVLVVEVHQATVDSSDLGFDAQITAYRPLP